MSEDEQRRILRLLAIEKEQRRLHESLKKWATENFAIFGHWKRAAEIKERAAENFSVLKYAPAKACSKKCTAGSKVPCPTFCASSSKIVFPLNIIPIEVIGRRRKLTISERSLPSFRKSFVDVRVAIDVLCCRLFSSSYPFFLLSLHLVMDWICIT